MRSYVNTTSHESPGSISGTPKKEFRKGSLGLWLESWGYPSHTVAGRNSASLEVGSLSHYLQGFIHPRWCRILSINSTIQLGNSLESSWILWTLPASSPNRWRIRWKLTSGRQHSITPSQSSHTSLSPPGSTLALELRRLLTPMCNADCTWLGDDDDDDDDDGGMHATICFFIVPNSFELWIDSPLENTTTAVSPLIFWSVTQGELQFLTSDPAPANLTKNWLENQPWDPWDHLPERCWNLPWRTAAVVWGGRTKMQAGSTSSQLARGATTKNIP